MNCLLLLLLLISGVAHADTAPYAWIEAENPTSTNFTPNAYAAGPPGVMSGKWVQISFDKEKAKAALPADGFLLAYEADAPQAGHYQIWARIGYEYARTPFDWRLGDGNWQTVAPDTRTTNVMRLGFFMEEAWLKLGEADLPAGKTRLQFRVKEPGKEGNILFALDCAALVNTKSGDWVPEGRLKPGENYDGDLDKAAAGQRFTLPAPAAANRVELPLNGTWQVARYDDPNMDADPYAPVKSLPSEADYPLRWMGVAVPSSAWKTPELVFGHRLIYRTRVQVPTEAAGRSFLLHFSGTNWIASVFVNGVYVGAHQGVLVPWDLDITKAIKPGQANEIAVAIKGSYYAWDTKAMNNSTLEKQRNIPNEQNMLTWSRWVAPIYPSTKGEGNGLDYGLVNPVRLTVAGPAYVSDVFVKTSVAQKRLDADVTLANTTGDAQNVVVTCEAVNKKTGQTEQAFAPVAVTLPAGSEQAVAVGGAWENPKLWWPVNDAQLYTLRTTVSVNDKPVDVHNQTFGFHEVTVDGIHIRLNGVIRNFWNWVGVSGTFNTPQEWLTEFRAEGNRFHRISADSETSRFFPYREAMLDFFDAQGVPGRLSTCNDGMFITYDLNNPLVWKNFTEHLQQVTKAYRNHPCIMMYSVENEVLYINAQNLGQIDMAEPKVLAMMQAGKAIDPTRPYMADGGGAGKGNLYDINCEHYPEGGASVFPANAYTFANVADHSARWPWDHQRPLVLGETFFYAGKLEDQAWIGGDRVFRGRDEANRGAAAFARLLVEGFRWQGAAGICPWVAESNLPGIRGVFSDLAVFTRKRALRCYAGKPTAIEVKVFNDTLSNAPVTLQWELHVGKQRVAGASITLPLEAGTAREQTLHFVAPPSDERRDGDLTLRVIQDGQVGFEDHKPIAIFPASNFRTASARDPGLKPRSVWRSAERPSDADASFASEGRWAAGQSDRGFNPGIGATRHRGFNPGVGTPIIGRATSILLYDKSGKIGPYLAARGIKARSLVSLKGTGSNTNGLLIVGPDTLTPDEAAGNDLLRFAASGGHVIVLEQNVPLTGTAFPAPVRTTETQGGYAYAQALGSPLFAHLKPDDFRDWLGDFPTFKKAYLKPSSGIRSLVECGDALNFSALLEAPCGRGVIVATQLRVGAKLGVEPAADQLFQNMLAVYGDYAPQSGTTAVVASADSPLMKTLSASGLRMERVVDVAAALTVGKYHVAKGATKKAAQSPGSYRVAVIEATPANLAALRSAGPRLDAFTQAGGWVVLHGLTPEGLAAFDALVGVPHPIRPFRLERVTLEAQGNPLAATLGNRDLTFYSAKEIAFGDYFLDNNEYNYVVGGGDKANIAPFCTMPDGPADPFAPYTPTYDDHDPYNYVNGLLNTDSWRYIRQIGINKEGQSAPLVFGFHRPATIAQINLWNNVNYGTIENLDIVFDGDDAHPLKVVLPANGSLNEIKVSPARLVNKSIALIVRSSRRHEGDQNLVGLDNVQFLQRLPAANDAQLIALDNVGGLVAYPRGKGGLFLCQLKLTDEEPNPENKAKKQRLFATLLQNMGAGSRSSEVAVPGLNVQFTPLDITRYANRHIKAQGDKAGWFGDRNQDLSGFKVGQQYYTDVLFHVPDYVNAPVPQSIMLGNGDAPEALRSLPAAVAGIAVGKKADALYFLHTALVTRPLQDWERASGAELFKYVVHYADGATVEIPVRLEEGVDNWIQNAPKPLGMARVAWSAPLDARDAHSPRATLYAFAWNNPKPAIAITSLDIVAGKDANRGVPAVLGITLGNCTGQ